MTINQIFTILQIPSEIRCLPINLSNREIEFRNQQFQSTAKDAYRRLAKISHSDVGGTDEKFRLVKSAYDEAKRMRVLGGNAPGIKIGSTGLAPSNGRPIWGKIPEGSA